MIYLYKAEVIMLALFLPALPLKTKLVAKYFLKNMQKQAFISNFQFSKILDET